MAKHSHRKKDHIALALEAQTGIDALDTRFRYEPMLAPHPEKGLTAVSFLGKELRAPVWISSMTGGTASAREINQNLARACREFGLGMGLGSCRVLMEDASHLPDFDVRDLIGNEYPLWANLGIAQLEALIENKALDRAAALVEMLRADGLIVHVNPLQEYIQAEGDRLKKAPVESIQTLLESFPYPVIVKEVGQGMGPDSLRALLRLPLAAIEFGAFGGTNFARLEQLREQERNHGNAFPFATVGESVEAMLKETRTIVADEKPACSSLIISGGIRSFLDGYYLTSLSPLPAVYGMASGVLEHARGNYNRLQTYLSAHIRGLEMAQAYLRIRT